MNKLGLLLLVALGSIFCGAHYDNNADNRENSDGIQTRILGGENISLPFFVTVEHHRGRYCSGVAMLSHLVVTSVICAMHWFEEWTMDISKISVWQGDREFKTKRLGFPQELDINNLMGTDIAYFELFESLEGPFYPPCGIKPGEVFTDAYVVGPRPNGERTGTFVRMDPDCDRAIKTESEICFHKFGGKGVLEGGDLGAPLFRFPRRETKCILGVAARTGDENVATRLDYYWPRIKNWYYLDSTR